MDWVREKARYTRRMASVCTGAFLLAASGLLDGHGATTHWRYSDELARRTFRWSIIYLTLIFAALLADHFL